MDAKQALYFLYMVLRLARLHLLLLSYEQDRGNRFKVDTPYLQKMIYYLLTIPVFFAAFLLFLIELIAAKILLPSFGGSFGVWAACVFFFQLMLFAGYSWAYWLRRSFSASVYRYIMLGLFTFVCLIFPVTIDRFDEVGRLPMVVEILRMLLLTIGPSFFLLASVSLVMQNLVSSSDLSRRTHPYSLYAVSNIGSIAALTAYPLVIERWFDIQTQLVLWRNGYTILVLLLFAILLVPVQTKNERPESKFNPDRGANISTKIRVLWLVFSAAASMFLLAVTNVLTIDIAAVPLLWVVPLMIYLISFVLTFKQHMWYPKWIEERFLLAAFIFLILFVMHLQSYILPAVFLIVLYCILLFVVCLVCHGELIRLKPAHTGNVSSFYLMIALGGWLGSLTVSWLIPLISTSLIEIPTAIGVASLGYYLVAPERRERWTWEGPAVVIIVLLLWSVVLDLTGTDWSTLITLGFACLTGIVLFTFCRNPRATALTALSVILLSYVIDTIKIGQVNLVQHRNYYGVYRVYDKGGIRHLNHGTTLHGSQFLDPARHHEALTYYHRTTPSGALLSDNGFQFERIALIGLGTGSLLTYLEEGQAADIYELDPYNEKIAGTYFRFIDSCRAELSMIFGDARLNLQRFEPEPYDLIIIDAFSSDAIPVHLLTVEAIYAYNNVLSQEGLLLFHISNKHLDLLPVLQANAQRLALPLFSKSNLGNVHPDAKECQWAVLGRPSEASHERLVLNGWAREDTRTPAVEPWTDHHSSILSALK